MTSQLISDIISSAAYMPDTKFLHEVKELHKKDPSNINRNSGSFLRDAMWEHDIRAVVWLLGCEDYDLHLASKDLVDASKQMQKGYESCAGCRVNPISPPGPYGGFIASEASHMFHWDVLMLALHNERWQANTRFYMEAIWVWSRYTRWLLPILFDMTPASVMEKVPDCTLEYGPMHDSINVMLIVSSYYPQFVDMERHVKKCVGGERGWPAYNPVSWHVDNNYEKCDPHEMPYLLTIRLTQVCMALYELSLPPYVLLEIVERLNPAWKTKCGAFGHKQRIARVISITQGIRQRRAQPSVDNKLVKIQ